MEWAGTRNNPLYCKCLTNDVVTKCTEKNSTSSYFNQRTEFLIKHANDNVFTLKSTICSYFYKGIKADVAPRAASLREPLLHAALEECEVRVPVDVLHSWMDTHRHVPASVQRLQPERIFPVELSGRKEERKITAEFKSHLNLLFIESARMVATYILVPHFHDFFTAVIETKVAVEKEISQSRYGGFQTAVAKQLWIFFLVNSFW